MWSRCRITGLYNCVAFVFYRVSVWITFMNLARQLIDGFCSRKSRGRPPNFKKQKVPDSIRMANVGVHMPKRDTYRRCKMCSGPGKAQKRTRYTCSFCKVPLCINPCFQNTTSEFVSRWVQYNFVDKWFILVVLSWSFVVIDPNKFLFKHTSLL